MFIDKYAEKNSFILCFKYKTDVFVFVVLVESSNVRNQGNIKPKRFKFKSRRNIIKVDLHKHNKFKI